MSRAPADLKAFRDLTSDNPVQQARADRLQRMLDQRLRGLDAGARAIANLSATPSPQAIQALAHGADGNGKPAQ